MGTCGCSKDKEEHHFENKEKHITEERPGDYHINTRPTHHTGGSSHTEEEHHEGHHSEEEIVEKIKVYGPECWNFTIEELSH